MQKHLQKLLLLAAMMLVPWVTQGQGFNYTCNFDSDSDTAGWVFVNGSQVNQWFIGTAAHNSGTKSLYISNNNGTSNSYSGSTSFVYAYQEFTLDSGGYAISYDWRCNGEGNYDYLRVFLAPSTVTLPAGASPNSTTTSAYTWGSETLPSGCISLTGSSMKLNQQSSWQNVLSEIYVPTSGTWRLVFAWANDASVYNDPAGAIDNIVFLQPTCPRPDNMQFANITPTSFDFSWTESGTATTWIIDIDSAGTSVLTDVVYDTFYSAIGLTANNMYTVRVAALCDGTDTSMWLSTNFHTPCSFIDSLPYQNDFENDPYYSAVTYAQAFPTCWTRINDATGTYNYYPYITTTASYVHSGSKGMYWYFTTTSGYAENEYAVLPGIDTTVYNISDLTLAFYAKTTSASYHPTPIVGVMTNPNDASTFTPVYTFSNTAITTDWIMYTVSFADYTGNGNFIAIKCPRPSSTVYMAIDDVFLTNDWCDIPLNVTASSDVNQVTVSWSPNGGNNFTVILGTDTVTNLTDSSYTFTGLPSNTPYHYAVATECTSTTSVFIEGDIRTACTFLDTLPYSYGFEDMATGSNTVRPDIPCWTHINNGTTYFGYPYVSSTTPHSGTRNLYWYGSTTMGTYSDYQAVVLPGLDTDVHAINTVQLTFWARPSSTSYSPVLQVGVMTNPYDINTFQLVQTINVQNVTTWQEFNVMFGAYTGYGNYIAVRLNRPSSAFYVYTDDFTISLIPNCPPVESHHVTATAGAAVITWEIDPNFGGSPESFEVRYGYASDSLSGATVSYETNPFISLSGLDADTTYMVSIAPVCGGTADVPYTFTFNTIPLPCLEWDTTSASGPRDTLVAGNDGTSTTYFMPINTSEAYSYCQHLIRTSDLSTTGPAAISGVGFQYAYSSPITTATNCSIYMAHTTLTTFTAMIPYDSLQLVYVGPMNFTHTGWNFIEFNQGNFNYDGVRNMVVAIVNNSGTAIGNSYVFYYNVPGVVISRREASSSPYTPAAMNAATGNNSNWRSNMRLLTGSGECLTLASCSAPAVNIEMDSMGDYQLTWIPGYQETSWDVDYREQGTSTWTTLAIGTSNTSLTILSTDLTSNTHYEFRVTAICSDTNISTTVNITTPCSFVTIPYSYGFEDLATGSNTVRPVIPCWNHINNGSSYFGYPYVYASAAHNGSRGLYWYLTTTTGTYGDYEAVVLPPVNPVTNPVNTLQLSFWARPSSTSYSPIFYVGVMTDPEDITTFQYVDTVYVTNSTVWQFFEVPLSSYTGNGRYVAVRANRPSSAWYAYFDDVLLENMPNCPRVFDVAAHDITQTDATITWTPTVATEYEVQYGSVGFTPGTGTSVNYIFADSVVLTGLTPSTVYDVYVRGLCSGDSSNWSFVYQFHTECQFATLPIIENFDSITGSTATSSMPNILPLCWDYYNDGTRTNYQGSPYVYNSTTYSHSGPNCIRFYSYNSSGDSNQYLILPIFDSNDYAISDLQLSFWLRGSSTSAGYFNNVVVGVMTDPNNEYSFIPYDTILSSTTTYTYHEVNLNRYTGPHGRITLLFPKPLSSSQYEYGYLDDLMLGPLPTCVSVDDLTSTHVSGDTIVLTWTPGGYENTWEVSYDSVNAIVYDSTYIAAGLSPNTEYTFTVRAICGVGDTSYPITYSVRTECGAISSLPYFESFEGLPAGASGSLDCGIPCYGRLDNATQYHFGYIGSSSSWPTGGHTGTGFIYYYMPTTAGTYADWIITILPPIDTIAYPLNDLQVSFWVKMNSASTMGDIQVGVISNPNDATTFVPVDTVHVAGNNYDLKTGYLSNFTGSGNRIALKYFRGTETTYYFVDDITIEPIPDCPPVSGITSTNMTGDSITVVWSENGTATSWDLEYGVTGFTPGSGTTVTVTTTPTYTLGGLTPNTAYDVYITPYCGSGVAATRMGTFRTACTSVSLPYTENFDSYTTSTTSATGVHVPCWDYIMTGSSTYQGTTYQPQIYYSSSNAHSSNYSLRLYGESYTMLPPVNAPLDSLQLRFWDYTTSTSYLLEVGVMEGSTFVPIQSITTPNSTHLQHTVYFGAYTGNSRIIAFRNHYNTTTTYYSYHYLDDVVVEYLPTCPPVVSLSDTAPTTSSITIDWIDQVSAPSWEVEYSGNGTTSYTTVTSHPVTINGLVASSAYQVRVRPICSATDTGSWSEPYSAYTACDLVVPPYIQDFNAVTGTAYSTAGELPPCWVGYSNGSSAAYMPHVTDGSTYSYSISGNALTLTSGSATYGDVKFVRLPRFAMPVSTLTMSYWFCTESSTNGTLTVGYMTGDDFTTDFVPVVSHPASSASLHSGNGAQPAGYGVYDTVSFENVPDSALYVAFKWVYTTSFYSCCIDNIEVTSSGAFCAAPTITSVTSDYHSATMTWTGTGTNYEVNIKESVATDWPATDIAVSGNSYTFNGLMPATNYTVRVRQDCTADSIGYSEWVIDGVLTDSLPCFSPDSLHATAVTNATATLDWNVNGNENVWDIHVWYGSFDSIYRTILRPATVGGFTAGITYNAAIRPVCGVNLLEGDWSDTVQFTTAVCPDITGLSTSNVTTNSVTLNWSSNPMALRWNIEYGPTGFTQGQGTQAVSNTNSYVVTGLSDGITYDFYVKAVCGDDWTSENWVGTSATTQEGTIPCDAPTGVSTAVADNSVTVNWTAGTGNISFELEYGPRGFSHGAGSTTTATSSPAVIANLDYETQYDVYVRAVCEQNIFSPWSTVSTFTTGERPSEDCDPVQNLTVTNVTETSADVSWQPGPTGDHWQVVLTDGTGSTISDDVTAERQATFSNLTPGTNYTVKVRTDCGDGNYSAYVTANFRTLGGEGIEDVDGISCRIFPNPATSSTTISVTGVNGMVRIAVVDMNGRTVATETLECSADCEKTMEVDKLAQGAYFVRITADNTNMVKKLIVR